MNWLVLSDWLEIDYCFEDHGGFAFIPPMKVPNLFVMLLQLLRITLFLLFVMLVMSLDLCTQTCNAMYVVELFENNSVSFFAPMIAELTMLIDLASFISKYFLTFEWQHKPYEILDNAQSTMSAKLKFLKQVMFTHLHDGWPHEFHRILLVSAKEVYVCNFNFMDTKKKTIHFMFFAMVWKRYLKTSSKQNTQAWKWMFYAWVNCW